MCKTYKTNCFAFQPETLKKKADCRALRFLNCEDCRFYKSRELNKTEQQKTKLRALCKGYYDNENDTYQPLKNEWSV